MRALETTGRIRGDRDIELDEPLPLENSSRVRVIVLVPDPDEIDEGEWLRTMAGNPAYAFLADPSEDIYSITDGKPFVDPA